MMAGDDLPDFIRRHVSSVWALEILMLMRGQPGRAWRAEEIAGELRATPALVQSSLDQFQCSGLVVPDETHYRYAPASPILRNCCDALAAAYRERPVAVINLICAPEERLQQLADAFRFRGDR